jgi:cobalt/nickel transport system permease protein
MHVHFLDPYRPRPSLVHQLDPRVKLVLTLAFILTTVLIPQGAWPVYILLLAMVISVVLLSELGIGYVFKRSVLAFPFVLAALPLVFTGPDPSLVETMLGVPMLGDWTLRISQPGLERFLSIAFKSWISIQAAIVLATSTPFPQLLVALRAIKTPRLLVAIFGLMWRYLFVLADETLRLIRARAARSGVSAQGEAKPGGSVLWRARVTGGMAGSLFLRAFERSDRIYMAMASRGYDGEVRMLPLPALKPVHWGILGAGVVLFAALLAIAYLL